MSAIVRAKFNSVLDLQNTHVQLPCSASKKKWHLAFTTIYCLRAFTFYFLKPNISVKPAFHRITIHDDDEVHNNNMYFSSTIDSLILSNLVKEKNLDQLNKLEGVQGICAKLKSDHQLGINGDHEDISSRQEAFGTNTYKKPKTKGFFHFVYEAFKDPTILILMVCAALSLGFGIKQNGPTEGWYDGGSIFVAVFLIIAVSTISNFRQSKQFDKLSDVSSNIQVEAVRNGRRQKISIFDILVGDVICLKIGDQVPADGLFTEGHSLEIDESSMTGESDHVQVNHDQNPFLFSGTKVVDGYAQMVVTSVGMNTTWGEMMSMINRDSNEEIPLQMQLKKLTSAIRKVGLAMAIVVLVILLVRYFTGNSRNHVYNGSETKFDDIMNAVIDIFAAVVIIVVIAIPEGMPLAVTLTLVYSMKRMMADQAMVRKLSACQTMGSATIICTDKTGTLTLNEMKVTKFWQGKECVEEISYSSISENILELLHQSIGLNTTCTIFKSGTNVEISGSSTEKAILSWSVEKLNMDMEAKKRDCSVLHVEAFNSEKKRSGVLMNKAEDGTFHVHWKGAAEMILAKCSHYYDSEGNTKPLYNQERVEFNQIIQGMAASSLRCIAFAHKQVSEEKIQENDLILLGIVGLKNPCRPGVKKAVEECQFAGVQVKMITGDNIFTAKAIATECGILCRSQESTDGSVIEGVEFSNYSEEERMDKVDKICVMARSSPLDKLLVVQCLRKKGHIVAVTGDGTNDAPALREADIGFSMGIQGTEVAKQSSDIVILDDNFTSVATVLRWGRCVYNNIQKFIQFQLTMNVAVFVIKLVAACSSAEVPLTGFQVLWVNLIMDTLGALALATDKPTKELMEKRPVGRTEPLITNIMCRNLLSQALYQITILLVLQLKGEGILNISEKVNDTMIFNMFVLCQVFNEFNSRKLEKKNVFEGVLGNKLFVGIIAVTLVLQVVMVEFFKKFADTERLNWGQWGICIAFGAASWPLAWIVKCIPVPGKPLFSFFSL